MGTSSPWVRSAGRGGDKSLAAVLAVLWSLLIVYASLYPFAGWRIPPGAGLIDLVRLPWTRWIAGFDPTSNLLGYLPLGLFWALSRLGAHPSRRRAVAFALFVAAALSYLMEFGQQFVPRRVPSAQDWVMNLCGAGLGACLAVLIDAWGWSARWRWLRDRWLEHGGRMASAVLLLWPVGLLFPSPLPFGLGQVGGWVREVSDQVLVGIDWAEPLRLWLESTEVVQPASPALESAAAVLGLLAPCLLAYAASAPGRRRAVFALGVPLVAAAAVTLSTALSFGPENALAWRTPIVLRSLALAGAIGLALMWTPPRLAGALALVVLTALVVLVHMAPADPYFAQSLQAWEQGRFIRFHGLAEWIGWLWPYAAIGWLLARAGSAR